MTQRPGAAEGRPRFKQIVALDHAIFGLDGEGNVWRWGDWYWTNPDGTTSPTRAGRYWKLLSAFGDPERPPEIAAEHEVAELLR